VKIYIAKTYNNDEGICLVRVIAIHYTQKGRFPKLTAAQLKELVSKVGKELKKRPEIQFKGTYVDDEGRGICDWEAPNAKAVKDLIDTVGVAPYDAVIEVKRILPTE
jgi:hypothetical protein